MAEPVLDAPRIVAGVGQGVAAGMPQHVRMYRKGEASEAAQLTRITTGSRLPSETDEFNEMI